MNQNEKIIDSHNNEAKEWLYALKNIDPDTKELADLYFERGKSYDLVENYEKAESFYSLAIELNPFEAEYFHWRGGVNLLRGLRDKAFQDLNIALKLYSQLICLVPHSATPFINRAMVYVTALHFAEAIWDLNSATGLDGQDRRKLIKELHLLNRAPEEKQLENIKLRRAYILQSGNIFEVNING